MVIRLKWTYILCFFLVLAALLAGAAVCHSDAKDTAVNTSVFEEQATSEKLLVYLFLDSITLFITIFITIITMFITY